MFEFEEFQIDQDQENKPNLMNVSIIAKKTNSQVLSAQKGHVKKSDELIFKDELMRLFSQRRKSRDDV